MVFFAVYPVVVWMLAIRWRRTLRGFAVVLLALVFLLLLNLLHANLAVWFPGLVSYVVVVQSVMYPYTVLVPGVALFCCCLPRHGATDCVRCGYAMRGLEAETDVCPECGALQPWAIKVEYRPSGMRRGSLHESDAPSVRRPLAPLGAVPPASMPPVRTWRADAGVPGFSGLGRQTTIGVEGIPESSPAEQAVRAAEQQDAPGQPGEQRPAHP